MNVPIVGSSGRRPSHVRRGQWRTRLARVLLAAQLMAMVWLVALLAAASSVSAADGQAEMASSGPLTRIIITNDLNCQVAHAGDFSFEFFGDEIGACGTFLAAGGVLYGPLSVPAAEVLTTGWTPVSQSAVAGAGSSSDPFRIVTTVETGTGIGLEQTDSYVVGSETYRTDVQISNQTGADQQVVLFRAGDCFLQDSDVGFGRVDNGAPACVISQASNARIEQWVPISPGGQYVEGEFSGVWQLVASQQPFPNTCACDETVDNGAGLSWAVTIPAGGSTTLSHFTFFSPEGHSFSAGAGVPFREAVPGPNQINLDPIVLASSLALAGGVVFVVPFPAALFNATLEENYDEVSGWWRRLGRRVSLVAGRAVGWVDGRIRSRRGSGPPPMRDDPATAPQLPDAPAEPPAAAHDLSAFWRKPVGVATFIGLSALLYALLDPTFGFSIESVGTVLGLALGLALTLAAYGVPLLLMARGQGARTIIAALPGTLFIAVACVILSRIANFQPGYLYGLIIGFSFSRELARAEEGKIEAVAAGCALAAAVLAWLALPGVRSGGGGIGSIILETALITVIVAGLEGALFAMLPLRFLPGELVRAWNVRAWAAIIGVAAFAFFHILLNPAQGYLADSTRSSMTTVIGLLVAFGAGSVGFWAYFRYIHQRSDAARGDPPSPEDPSPAATDP